MKNNERQSPVIPGIGANEPMFPRGRKLICYIPYRVEILDSHSGLVDIILIKTLEVDLRKEALSHIAAVESLTNGRKELWVQWRKFKKSLEYNETNSLEEIVNSRELLKEIHRKEMWQKEPDLLSLINVGQPLSSEKFYPVDFPYSEQAKVAGLVIRYEKANFSPVYDMEIADSNKYWEFDTDYIRKHAIAVPDWDNPAGDKNVPPFKF